MASIASELPRIFDRFFRGSRANEARGSGSGLGLAIVRSIVEMHGGTVAVESRLDAGTTFTVILPRDPHQSDGTNPVPPSGSAPDAPGGDGPYVAETSSSGTLKVNPDRAG